MPDLEISNLPALTGPGLDGNDPVAVADLSASETKKITAKDLVQSGIALVDDASIPAAKVAALGSAQLAANSVGSSQLANDSVDSSAIQAGAVTDAKIASGVSGSKLSNGTVTAAKLGAVTDRGLDQVGGNIGHTNTVTAGTASGITFDAQGHITATGAIPAADLPLATTTTVGGVIVPTDGGLEVSVTGEVRHEHDVTADIVANISFDEHGHINYVTELQPGHLPIALTNAVGAVQVPAAQGLSIDASGSIGLTNTGVTAGTYTKITVDAYGRATTGTTLTAADIPDLNVSKFTTGALATARIADDAITAAKLGDKSTATIAETTPAAGAFIGQTHLNSLTGDYFLWDGNVWQPIGISVGEVVLAGTYDASTNLMATVTSEGTALGFTVGSALPAAATANKGYYVVVSEAGTGTSPAPTVSLSPPDFLLSTGSEYTEIDVSSTVVAQVASNVSFSPAGDISATNVQAAIEELDTEKVGSASPTFTGTVGLGTNATIQFEGATTNDYETTLTVVDPTADRTITLPDVTGTVITTGDTGSVTSAMISDGTIVNADISNTAEIAVSKLANGTARQLLQTDAVGTGVEFTSNVDIPGTLDVTGAAVFDSTVRATGAATLSSTLGVTGATTLSSTLGVTGAATLSSTLGVTGAATFSSTALFTGAATFNSTIIFEGSTADANETTLTVEDPTADRTITLPDATTTVAGLAVVQSFTKAQRGTPVALTDAATIAVDLSLGNNFTVTLAGNRTLGAPTNVTAGQSGVIVVTQDTTGSRTLAYNSVYKFAGGTAPTLTTTASAVDVLAYYVESSSRITVTSLLNVS